ncbi:unnamed protein product [Eruca vesicaria subsp. sativa]|uniref:Methyltransferase n=1 Tax=Eruca vesicaria subsp. sativa TaxID=29727 RepID=A0ABC8JG38_ERUVS|nr:unnamed protein product [Eruca vesicaria subsp. sativa]
MSLISDSMPSLSSTAISSAAIISAVISSIVVCSAGTWLAVLQLRGILPFSLLTGGDLDMVASQMIKLNSVVGHLLHFSTLVPYHGWLVFDLINCARVRVIWHIESEGGKLLLEPNRALRPVGFFVWSATPVYRKNEEDPGIWKAMSELTKAMCWKLVAIKKEKLNEVGAAIYQKPINDCYNKRPQNDPPLCKDSDDQNAAWNVPLEACMHKVTEDFTADQEKWKTVVSKSYIDGMGIDWSNVRNVMDMKAVYPRLKKWCGSSS